MKKMALILSVLLAFTMLATSAFAATPTPAIEKAGYNNFPLIGDFGYTKHVIYDGLPQTGTEETLESGVRFAVYPTKTANLQVTNDSEKITAAFKEGTTEHGSEVLENIFTGYPVTPSTHKGIVCYEWKVRFNTAIPAGMTVQSRAVDNNWGIISTPKTSTYFSPNTEYTIGLAWNTITGAWCITKDGVKISALSGTYSAAAGLNYVQLQFTFNNVAASIDILDAKLTYYEQTGVGAYSKVLFSGIPSSTDTFTNENGVGFQVDGNTTLNNGKLVLSGAGAKAYMKLEVNPTLYPNGGKLYYEYTVSTVSKPNLIWLTCNGYPFSYNYVNGEIKTNGKEHRIGIEYDILTGNYAFFSNGFKVSEGTYAKPATGFKYMYLETNEKAYANFTIHDMKLVYYKDDYTPSENIYLEGVDNTPRTSWAQNKGVTFAAVPNSDIGVYNTLGTLVATVATNSDDEDDTLKLNYKVTEAKTPTNETDRLYFEFKGAFSAVPAALSVSALNADASVFEGSIDVSEFSDTAKDHTVALVYNMTSGEWYTLVNGKATKTRGKISQSAIEAGITDFNFQWKGAAAADTLTVKNIKAGLATGVDTVGNITLSDNEASVSINKVPYSSLGNSVPVIVAQYQGNRMLSASIKRCTLLDGDNTIKAELPAAEAGVAVKVFVWSDVDHAITPLTAAAPQ